ncbi:MAG TPA: FtsX-like permease family protein, partial [Gemmatimonadales bacterium]|nr:FtsX-like permease family protein [Gemmatimonadales bacterium]
QRRFTLVVILAFAATALLLAAIGIFGVLSYVVKLRGQEFGIRAALGASPGRILGTVIRQGAMVVGLGILFGLAGSVALSRVLGSLVFQVSPLDPVALLGAALLLIVSGTLASWLPARRAAEADPRRSLE